MDHDDRHEILERHVTMLREHFDSVEIVACRTSKDGTARHEHGSGSWYERFGMMRSWVLRHDETERIAARNREAEDD